LIRVKAGSEPRAGRNMDEMAGLLAKATGLAEDDVLKAMTKILDKKFKPNTSKPPFISMMQELGIDGIEFRGQLKEWAKKVGAIQFGPSGGTNRVDLSGRYLSSFSPSKQARWGLIGSEGQHSATRISKAKLKELVDKDIDMVSNDGATITSDPRPNGETYYHLYDAETGNDVGTFTSLEDAHRAWENSKADLARFNGTEIIREGGIDFKREAGIIEPELPLKGNPHLRQMAGQKWDLLINGRVVQKGIRGKTKAVHTLTTMIDPKHERLPMTYDEILAFGLDKRSVAFPPEVTKAIAKKVPDASRPTLPDSVLLADVNDVSELDELLQNWAIFNSKQEIPLLADLSVSERKQVLTTLLSDVYNRDNLRPGGSPLGLFIAEEGFDGIHIPDQGTVKLEKDHIAFMKSERDQVDNLDTSNRTQSEELRKRNEDMQDSHGPISDARASKITQQRVDSAKVYQRFHTDLETPNAAELELQNLTREAELELEEALLDLREVTGDDDLTFADLKDGESQIFRIMAEAEQAGARMEDVKVAMDKYTSCLRRG